MADATGTFGFDLLLNVGKLFWVNLIAAVIILFFFYPLTLRIFSRLKIRDFFRAMIRPQIVAFSTSSSMATLPVTMETCEEKLGVSKETTAFVFRSTV